MQLLNRLLTPLLLVSISCWLAGCHSDGPTTTAIGLDADLPGIQDRIFVQDALAAGGKEVAIAQLGAERAQNLDLQLLAQRRFDDYSQAVRDLEIIADQANIPLTTIGEPIPRHLATLSGRQFDEAYLHHMLNADRTGIKKFEAAARNARSREIRGFAARNLPALREHLRIAQNIQRIAGLGPVMNEAAGAEAPGSDISPFYQGDLQRRHQFDAEK